MHNWHMIGPQGLDPYVSSVIGSNPNPKSNASPKPVAPPSSHHPEPYPSYGPALILILSLIWILSLILIPTLILTLTLIMTMIMTLTQYDMYRNRPSERNRHPSELLLLALWLSPGVYAVAAVSLLINHKFLTLALPEGGGNHQHR